MNSTSNINPQEIEVLRTLIDESPMPIGLYTGREMRIRIANKAIQEAWGKDVSVIGKTFREAIPELENQPFSKLLGDVYTTGTAYEAKEDRVDLVVDGRLQIFYYDFTYKPLKDASGKVWGILNTATNVTDLVLQKKKAEESEVRFKSLVKQAPIALCVLKGPEFIVEIANKGALEIWGRSAEEMMNKPVLECLPEIKDQGFGELLTGVLKTKIPYTAREHKTDFIREGRKETVYLNFVYEPLLEKDGSASGVMVVATDVTVQVIARRKIEDFIGIASHELKTPITALRASLQLLSRIKNDPGSEMLPRLIDQANSSMAKVGKLVEDLLNVTRMKEGQIILNKSVFTLSTLINDCCPHVRTAGTHEIIVKGDLELEVNADAHRIDQVIVNFVNNAVKYAPQSKEIKVTIERVEDQAKVSVSDFGPGIPEDKLPHLFERFYQADHKQNQYSGLGLGLYISAEIIRQHQGQIGVESGLGKGSTFWFTIPIDI